MALFNFGKQKTSAPVTSIHSIKVLGGGCKSCRDLLTAAQAAAKNVGLSVEVEYITDIEQIMEYGILSTPALLINDKTASTGRVLKPAAVEKLLREFGG